MALSNNFRRNIVRQFSASCQGWVEKRLDIYQSKPIWDEKHYVKMHVAKMKAKKQEAMYDNFRDQMVFTFTKIGRWFKYKGVFLDYLREKILEEEIMSQQFIPERVDILGPDLAAAHFILSRGGQVKFWGENEWIGGGNKVVKMPVTYTPGYYIEGINASGMQLHHEGLECLYQLNKLKWLSLKGLTNLNDFSLDLISGRYGQQLEYLDLSGCTGITHYGLACLYKFKSLKMLNVTGIQHSPEFKLACLMAQDLLPDLEIVGIDFSINKSLDNKNDPDNVLNDEKAQNLLQ